VDGIEERTVELELGGLQRGVAVVVGSARTGGELTVLLTLEGPDEGLAGMIEVQAQVSGLAGGTRGDGLGAGMLHNSDEVLYEEEVGKRVSSGLSIAGRSRGRGVERRTS